MPSESDSGEVPPSGLLIAPFLIVSSCSEEEEKEGALVSHPHLAAAKSLQSCPTLCDPIEGSPPGSSVHGIFQVRILEWGASLNFPLSTAFAAFHRFCIARFHFLLSLSIFKFLIWFVQ